MLFGLTNLLPEASLTLFDNLEFLLRMLLSGILGALIGLERANRNKEAGIRTHIIIAVSAATLMILSKYAFMDLVGVAGAKEADPSRIASQVVSGISFLGAGVIFRQGKYYIRGLTTAAGMWATASVGMAVGAGLYFVGIVETAILVIMQVILHKHPVGNDALTIQEVRFKLADESKLEQTMTMLEQLHKGKAIQSEITRESNGLRVKLTVRGVEKITPEEARRILLSDENIRELGV